MSISELNEGPGVLELGVSKLLEEVGVLELLGSYVINVPPTAEFISHFEVSKAMAASDYISARAGDEYEVLHAFEMKVLYRTLAATSSVPEGSGSGVLHDAFFEVLADCGRDSAWPEVELFVMGDGRGYDVFPEIVESSFGLSYYEYQQFKHECARHAASYTTFDRATRDELLAPQRDHYTQAVLDGLAANPHIEVPAKYRDEVDKLMRAGW